MLVKMLRAEEIHKVKATVYRVKYVPGQNLGSMLVKSNPWAGMLCGLVQYLTHSILLSYT